MIWTFCLQSVFREYGWQFLRRIAVPHPVKTARAFLQIGRIDVSDNMLRLSGDFRPGAKAIVGVGFCLKPMDPPCPAGRANHDCLYFEQPAFSDSEVCRNCAVREFGILTLKTGSAFYVMTSARDILLDVFAPSIREGRFTSGLFVLCRYSTQPFAVGMLVSGIRGCMFQYYRDDCRDYRTWLLADRGIKNEQTEILDSTRIAINNILQNASSEPMPASKFNKRGNIYFAE